MHTLSRFWNALEYVLGWADVPAAWQEQLSAEFDLVKAFLRPRGGLAVSYPRLGNTACGAVYEVISHGPDDHVGVCPETGERIGLTTADITIHEVDRLNLARQVATALGCEFQLTATDLHLTSRLGAYVAAPGMRFPVYLTTPWEPRALRAVVDRLAATEEGPFLLLSPTRRRSTPDSEALLRAKGAALIPLCEVLALDDQGRLQPTEGAKTELEDFRRLALAVRRPPAGGDLYVFRLQGEMWNLTFAGKTALMEDVGGLHYIAWLLARPRQTVHVAVVETAVSGRRSGAGSAAEQLDEQALAEYRERLEDLQEEIAESKQCGDLVRHEKRCLERSQLLATVQRATGLGGRRRKTGDTDRLRRKIKMAIGRALTSIKPRHPELARHLHQSLQTGEHLGYQPATLLPWTL